MIIRHDSISEIEKNLTEDEKKVAIFLCEHGIAQKDIPINLNCSLRHAKTLVANLKDSLGATNLAQVGMIWAAIKFASNGALNKNNYSL